MVKSYLCQFDGDCCSSSAQMALYDANFVPYFGWHNLTSCRHLRF